MMDDRIVLSLLVDNTAGVPESLAVWLVFSAAVDIILRA